MGNKNSKGKRNMYNLPQQTLESTIVATPTQTERDTQNASKLVINKTRYDDKTFAQFVVHGYTRSALNESLYIPNDILSLVATFYGFYSYLAHFDSSLHGEHLAFHRSGFHVTKTKSDYTCSVCLFGNQVYSDVCSKYEISFRLHHLSHDFMAGFVTSSGDIKNWNNELGRDNNLYYSTGIYIYKHLRYFEHCDRNHVNGEQLAPLTPLSAWSRHFLFKMSFDFQRDTFSLYVNDKLAVKRNLKRNKQIIPAFGLNDGNDKIEIKKWEFIDHENRSINDMISTSV